MLLSQFAQFPNFTELNSYATGFEYCNDMA